MEKDPDQINQQIINQKKTKTLKSRKKKKSRNSFV